MSHLFISIYSSGGGGVKFMKPFRRGGSYKSLGTSDLDDPFDLSLDNH
jgi:hypothetical protein